MSGYVQSDAEPSADTFIGHVVAAPANVIGDAIARAHAARAALRELDGKLPEQPLAVTVRRSTAGAVALASDLSVAAFAIGGRIVRARLAARLEDEGPLAARLAGTARPDEEPAEVPFVTVALGDERIETARHGHRRAWRVNGVAEGPWLGLGRAGGMNVISTCHMIVDGYGHAWLAARIAALTAELAPHAPQLAAAAPPPLASIPGALPIAVAWRALDGAAPRALPLAYALGCLLHADRPRARRSPSLQIPIAPGASSDPMRRLRRVVPALASVRFSAGAPEPFAAFSTRTHAAITREAGGTGVVTRLLSAARYVPAPIAWKRRALGTDRPRWLEPLANLIGGRACASRIRIDPPAPPACAVSSPPTHAGLVATIVDDGTRSAITLCGAGASAELLDRLIGLLPR